MINSVLQQIKSIFDAYGVPVWVWYPILIAESSGDPNAVGDDGCSFGLFQLNQCAGQGMGHSSTDLFDPIKNAQIAAAHIGASWQTVKGSSLTDPQKAYQTAVSSGHPLGVGFATTVADFIAGGGSLPTLGTGSTGGASLAGFDLPSLDSFGGLVPVLLVGGGALIVLLVLVSFIFQGGTKVVREVLETKKEIGV